MHFYRKGVWAWLYIAALIMVLIAVFWHGLAINRLETDLTGLLPREHALSAAHQAAEKRMNQRLNRDVLVLIGGKKIEEVEIAAQTLQKHWQNSGLFESVSGKIFPDLDKLRADATAMQIATLSQEKWLKLQQYPQQEFAFQAQALVNPFAQNGVIAVQQDWLGLKRAVLDKVVQDRAVSWNAQTGWLNIIDGEKTWLLLRARLPEKSGLINIPNGLLPLVHDTQIWAKNQKVDLLMTGGALFAAENKAQGEQESTYMSVFGIGLTFLLLGGIFKTARILVLLLPLAIGMIMGVAVTILILGKIHILTLVVGTSLVGVLLDFPLHWLVGGIITVNWQRWEALHVAAKAFLLSLIITLLGYIALLPTPLPILRQTAIFSVAALITTFAFNVLCLPIFFKNWQEKTIPFLWTKLQNLGLKLVTYGKYFRSKPYVITLLIILSTIGLIRLKTQDDIRQWITLSPQWLAQSQRIAQLTETEPSAQYFLITAVSDEELLYKNQILSDKLALLQNKGVLKKFQSLNQWIVSENIQKQRQQILAQWVDKPNLWQSVHDIGVDDNAVKNYLKSLAQLPIIDIKTALKSDLATPWQDLYLGKIDENQVAAWISITGVQHWKELQQLQQPKEGIFFVDQRSDLNKLFVKVRNNAIFLKIASYILALLVLIKIFGWQRGMALLAVPVCATLLTVTVFGYMGWTLSLFAIFGLFLVTAVGMDYAIYASVQAMTVDERLGGILLSALTTFISFAILGLSSTPAIAAFGRSVALGVLFSVIISLSLLERENKNAKI